ncbi:hypothetical protein TPCG7_01400 [Cutibacterium granulosum]|nr:hypothetical protein TPCG7_01400 [Cutibacterium granulosum]
MLVMVVSHDLAFHQSISSLGRGPNQPPCANDSTVVAGLSAAVLCRLQCLMGVDDYLRRRTVN